MIDKLTISLSHTLTFSPCVRRAVDEGPALSAKGYTARYDLRRVGIPAMFYYSCRHTQNHLLSILDVAGMNPSTIFECIAMVVRDSDDTISKLPVKRVDYAIDIPSFPLDWFREHCYVARKKRLEEYYQRKPHGAIVRETLILGSYGNRYLIYDKIAQIMVENIQRKKRGQQLLSLSDGPLTRGERQTAVPGMLAGSDTLGELLSFAPYVQPFTEVHMPQSTRKPLDRSEMKPKVYALVRAFLADVERDGIAVTRAKWRQHDAHFDRVFKIVEPFVDRTFVPSPDLNALYGASVRRQYALPSITATGGPQFGGDTSLPATYEYEEAVEAPGALLLQLAA
jgi:hypothetical protein